MEILQIVFGPTGGTQKVADLLAEEWGHTVCRVDLTDPVLDTREALSLPEADLALIAVPSYAGRVPAVAAERLGHIRADGMKCVLVCVYGNRAYEDTLVELQDRANVCGFAVTAAVAAIAEHSIMHQYAAGRPDAEDREELKEIAQKIKEKLACGEEKPVSVPGNRPYKEAKAASMVPVAGDACTGCGLCAEKCPVRAISKDHPDRTDETRCISCMRCVAVCPQKARKADSEKVVGLAARLKEVCSVRKGNELFI